MEEAMDDKVTLKADGREFLCNKQKLITSSDYFRAMFSSNFSEKDKDVIELQDIDGACLQTLLEYAETGTYNIPSDGTLALLQTAAMLQFPCVQSDCEKEVFGSLSCESCLEIHSVTSLLGLTNIAKSARAIALWNFRTIIETPKYLHLSYEVLYEYLRDPSLFMGPNGEWTVWEAVINWIEADELPRTQHIKELLSCIDFKLLTADDIANMLFYSIVSENEEVVQILEAIRKYKRGNAPYSKQCLGSASETINSCDDGEETINANIEERVCFYMNCLTRKKSVLPCVVGFKQINSKPPKKDKNSDDEEDYCNIRAKRNLDLIPVLYTFNPSSGKLSEELSLTKLCYGPVLCSGYQVCSVGPSVYILGGEFQLGHGNWNLEVWRYSTATKKWISESSLPRPRRHHMICVVDTVIYIMGGFGRHRVVQSSVNAYDTASGEWISCPDMPHYAIHGAVCAFKGRVMVFTSEMQLLTYYPNMKKWSAVPLRSPSKQGYRAAVPWKNYIYLADNCSTKVYRYSPEGGQTIVEHGFFLSYPINVCIVDGKMYNFTHDDLDNHVIEVLDINDDDENDQESGNTARNSFSEHGGTGVKSEKCPESKAKVSNIPCEVAEEQNSAAVAACNVNKGLPLVIDSREVWREGNNGRNLFTWYAADPPLSVGCFPLLKL